MNQVLRQLSRNFPGGLWGKMRVQGQWTSCSTPFWGNSRSRKCSGSAQAWGILCFGCSSEVALCLKAGKENEPAGELCFLSGAGIRTWSEQQMWVPDSLPTSHPSAFHWTLSFPHHCRTHSHIGLKIEINLHSNSDLDLSSQLDVIVQEIPGNDDFLKKSLAVILT